MVGEFPELQGLMGRYYAEQQGEDASVAAAIEEHYKPQGPNDRVPTDPVAVAVALADKLDTLVGFWAIDEKPTGSKDPYALRRAALGVIRLVLENEIRCGLLAVINKHRKDFGSAAPDLLSFFADRLKVHLRDQGARHDLIDAVFALEGQDDLLMIVRRVEALGRFLDSDDGKNLLVGTKRAANILRIEEKKRRPLLRRRVESWACSSRTRSERSPPPSIRRVPLRRGDRERGFRRRHGGAGQLARSRRCLLRQGDGQRRRSAAARKPA